MRKTLIITIVIGALLFFASFLQADDTLLASYYNDYISIKIAQCNQQATMINAKSDCIKSCTKMRVLLAKFLTEHKAELVEDMLVRKVDMKPYRVDYFLTKAFFDTNPKLVTLVTRK